MADVPVINPSGESVSIPEEQLDSALQQGYVSDPPEAQAARAKETQYGTLPEMGKTALEGFTQGIAGPASPAIEHYFGNEPAEDIRGREEVNPWTHGIAKAAGLGVGLLSGEGLPGAAVGIAEQLGLPTLGRAAVEMGILGVGDEASKAILQDPNQTATNAIAHVGLSAALGGALGLGGEMLANTFGKAGKAVANSKLGQWTGDMVDRLGYHVDNPNLGESLSDTLSKYYTDMKSMTDSVRGGEGIKAQDIAQALPPTTSPELVGHVEQVVGNIRSLGNRLEASPDIYSGGGTKAFRGYTNRLFDKLGITEQQRLLEEQSNLYDKITAIEKTPDVPQKLLDSLAEAQTTRSMVEGSAAIFGEDAISTAKSVEQDLLNKIETLKTDKSGTIRELHNSIDRIARTPKGILVKSPAELFTALDQFKRDIGPLSSWNAFTPNTEKPVSTAIKEIYGKVQDALEDKGAWGQAGKIQSDINDAWTKYIPALKDAEKSFTIPTAEGERIIDPGKMQTYINQTGKLSGEIKRGRMSDFLEASENFKNTLKDTYSRLGLEVPETTSPQALLDTTNTLSGGAKFADALVKRGLAKMGGQAIGGGVGAVAGSVVGAPGIGAALGSVGLGSVFESLLPTIGKSLFSKEASAPGLKAAVDFASSAIKADSTLNKGIRAIVSGNVIEAADRFIKSSPEELEKLDKLVGQLQQSPDKLLSIGSSLAHYMPDHSNMLAAQSSNIISYLSQKRPHAAQQLPFDREFEPNRVQDGAWKRTLQLADKPLSIMSLIQSGRSTAQDVQDMQNMYPQMMKSIQDKIMRQVLDVKSDKGTIPYSTRMHLSLFAGEPLDSTMTPQVAFAAQAVFAAANGSQSTADGAQKRSKGSNKALDKVPQTYATPLQARALEKQNKPV
jgi:hypothetical protein